MSSTRALLATTTLFLGGCNAFVLAPASSHLDLVQASRLTEDQTQVSLTTGAVNASLGARQTFGMGQGTAGDVGLNLGLYHSAFDGGLWIPMKKSALRLGLTGGLGQAGFSALIEEEAPTAGIGFPAFGGGTIHVQHQLGKKRKKPKTAWSFTHGYGYAGYLNPSGYDALFSLNIDTSVRVDFNAREARGVYTAFGAGTNWIIPHLSARVGYRL